MTIKKAFDEIQSLPFADKLIVFGSVARHHPSPVDIDIVFDARHLNTINEMKEKLSEIVDSAFALSSKHGNVLDFYLWVKDGLFEVKNSQWVVTKNQSLMAKAIQEHGIPLGDVRELDFASLPLIFRNR